MTFEEIYKLWDRFEASGLQEFEIENSGTSLKLKKPESVQMSAPLSVSVKQPEVAADSYEQATEGKGIKAPLVGTFYTAPSPDSKPFVKIGDIVKKGDVIGIIEAMKLMNEVTAAEDGVVEKILVADGSFVEFGQMLIVLK